MPESLDVLKLRVLLCFLNEEPKTCTVTGLAGVLGEGKQKVSRMLMALEREGLLDRSDPRRPCLTEAGEHARPITRSAQTLCSTTCSTRVWTLTALCTTPMHGRS